MEGYKDKETEVRQRVGEIKRDTQRASLVYDLINA